MPRRYAKGKHAVGECARSGRKMFLKDMVHDGYYPNLVVDPAWFDDKHPQESLPTVEDPVALWRPAPERDKIGSTLRFGQGFGGLPNIDMGFDLNDPTLLLEVGPVTLENEVYVTQDETTADLSIDLTGTVEDGYFIFFLVWSQDGTPTSRFTPNQDQQILFQNDELASGSGRFFTEGTMYVCCYYKFWRTGDDLVYTWAVDRASNKRMYCKAWIYSNVNETHPIDNFAWADVPERDGRDTSFVFDADWVGPALRIGNTNSHVFETWLYKNSAAGDGLPAGTFVGTKVDPYTAEGVIDQAVERFTGSQEGWMFARTMKPDTLNEGVNLLKWTRPGDYEIIGGNWTSQDPLSGAAMNYPEFAGAHITELAAVTTDGITPHLYGIEQSVVLTGGVEYCLVFGDYYQRGTQGVLSYTFIGYEDTFAAVKGSYLEVVAGTIGAVEQTREVGSPWSSPIIQRGSGVNQSSGSMKGKTEVYLFFTPAVNGTYKILLNVATGANLAAATTSFIGFTGNAQTVLFDYLALYPGTQIRNPTFTGATAITTPDTTKPGVLNRTYVKASQTSISGRVLAAFACEIVGKVVGQGRITEARAGISSFGGQIADDDGFGVGNDYTPNTFMYYVDGHANVYPKLVYPTNETLGSTGKYYIEIQFGTTISPPIGTGGSSWSPSVAVTVPAMNIVGLEGAQLPGEAASNRRTSLNYQWDGDINHNLVTSAVDPWPDNNAVIGMAMDYVNGEMSVYLNGVLQATRTLDPLMLTKPVLIHILSSDAGSQTPFRIGARLADFIYTKPAGFQDWDWASQ